MNGKSWPESNPSFSVTQGRRYWLTLDNQSGDPHPIHLHRHSFEVLRVSDKCMSGIDKDTLHVPRFNSAEIEFVADNPGPTLFHCHQQDHQDEGFMGMIMYPA
jgi:FtsP/CotA-like multicopper oxidase with cupredoxin domain